MEQDFVDLVGHPLPAVIEPVLVHGTAEGLGKGKIEVQLPVILLQHRKGRLLLRQAGLFHRLPRLPAAQELEKQLPQALIRLVKGDIGRPKLLLAGEDEPHLPHLGNDGDIAAHIQLAVRLHRGHSVPLGQNLQQVEIHLEHQVREPRHGVLQRRNDGLQPRPDGSQILGGPHVALGVHAVPPRPSGDLTDLLRLQLPALHAVIFFRLHEDDAPDGEIQPHPNGVGGDDIFHLARQKALHLLAAGGVGQRPVYNGRFLAVLAQVLRHTEHPHL